MAGPLAAIERFFERIFERPPARLFAPRLEPEFLQRELFRALEAERVVRGRRTYVPTSYRLQLSATDLATLADPPKLSADLAEGLRAHTRSRGYVMASRPQVRLEPSNALAAGEVIVVAEDPPLPPLASPGRNRGGRAGLQPPPAPSASASLPVDPGHTATFAAARPNGPSAVVAVHVPGHIPWRVSISSGRLRVGRAADNDLVLVDDRVSRHHGQISVRFGTLVYADLGSTNGSYVNGERVSEIALGPTDVLQLGSSSLTVEHGP